MFIHYDKRIAPVFSNVLTSQYYRILIVVITLNHFPYSIPYRFGPFNVSLSKFHTTATSIVRITVILQQSIWIQLDSGK